MKTAGILTFHNAPNYGAVLQAYALSNYLKDSFSYTVDIIDFQCAGNGQEFDPAIYLSTLCRGKNPVVTLCKKTLIKMFFERGYREKNEKFRQFREKYLSVVPFGTVGHYGTLLFGSDQIWNPAITNGFRPEYFGETDMISAERKVSYAASCGDVADFSEEQQKTLVKHVLSLDSVGVREKSLCDFLSGNGVDCACTVDPTFLLTENDYDALLQSGGMMGPTGCSAYLLVYELQKDAFLEQNAFAIAREKNLEVKILSGYADFHACRPYEIRNAGPIEFLSLVRNARYVLTNSFHGTAFSLIYRKPFNVVLPVSRSSRIMDLLATLHLCDRVITGQNLDTSDIDYDSLTTLLQDHVRMSKNYLERALGESNGE